MRTWTCRGCKAKVGSRIQRCGCGRKRPAKRVAAHLKALELPYEAFLELNGGVELCGICGAAPKSRRLHRDHDHKTGKPRALLCMRCNTALRPYMTVEWVEAALAYLRRAA